MSFKPVNFAHIAKFNSANSSEFLEFYQTKAMEALQHKAAEPSQRTFAPSSSRCLRKSWFRLRGTVPDVPKTVDTTLQFTADIGTACHRIIQRNLKSFLCDDWIDVEDWFTYKIPDAPNPISCEYKLTKDPDSLETYVEIIKPYPIRFACDGIIRWQGKYYLIEIKTTEFGTWDELTDPESQHIAQVTDYGTLLGLHNVLFLYQDRQYGEIKCYEYTISDADMQTSLTNMDYVMQCVDTMIPPPALPKGDKWCSPNRCQYYQKCKQW